MNRYTPEECVQSVQNMMIKELTGMLTHTMHSLARTVGATRAQACSTPAERARAMEEAMEDVFPIANVLTQQVMNAKKVEGGLTGLNALAAALRQAISAEEIDVRGFQPFLPETLFLQLERLLGECGKNDLKKVRDTAFGQVVAMGKQAAKVNKKGETGGSRVVDAMLNCGYGPRGLVQLLEADAMGEILPLVRGEKQADEESEDPDELAAPKREKSLKLVLVGKPTDLPGLFTTIQIDGGEGPQEFLKVSPEIRWDEGEQVATLTVFIRPLWVKKQSRRDQWVRMEIAVPNPEPLGKHGHARFFLPDTQPRVFRPQFVPSAPGAAKPYRKVGARSFLQRVIMDGLQKLGKRRSAEKGEPVLNNAIGTAVRQLPRGTVQECMVLRYEYEVLVQADSLLEEWAIRLEILGALAEEGYDILTTSKNHPGHIVTRAGKYGVAPFLAAVNPFVEYGQGKRRSEGREMRSALPLAHPEPPRLLREGAELPAFLMDCLTNLRVLVADVDQLNQWAREGDKPLCFDTLLACPSIMEKLALQQLVIQQEEKDRTPVDELVETLRAQGLKPLEPVWELEDAGNGLRAGKWIVTIPGPITCLGKIKAAVGPIKGVMTMMPVQLVTRTLAGDEPIDLVVPRDTLERKEGWDAVLYLMLTALGITAIPAGTMEELLALLEERQAETMSSVTALYEDGREGDAGLGLVGWLPFYRPRQTTPGSFRERGAGNGIKMPWHALLMSRTGEGQRVDWQTPAWQYEEFDSLVVARQQAGVGMLRGSVYQKELPAKGGGTREAARCSNEACQKGITPGQRTYSQHHAGMDLCPACVKHRVA